MAGKGGGAWKVAYADFVTAMMAFKRHLSRIAHGCISRSELGGARRGFDWTVNPPAGFAPLRELFFVQF
jgi:hypothetical protein